ncbi:MAG TPA: PDR/VanB family oxidoreductase [Casimicrobiaceae bacterium]|nr:PDR/VanB family oxidoreductase [Casimicrobiaceae bacterium]
MPEETPEPAFRELFVSAADFVAEDIKRFELRDPANAALPAFTAGSHIPLVTPTGALRRYSLCNDPREEDRYEIAVKRDAAGRGGSISICDTLNIGDRVDVAEPRSEFSLAPRAKRFLFIAGGIGITPILSMMRHLATTRAGTFKLVYLTRNAASTAFADVLAAPAFANVTTIHHDEGDPNNVFDLWPLLERPTSAHVYCCGPRALMDSVRDMSGHWPFGAVHFESFGVDAATRRNDTAFDVHLAQSGRVVHVPANQSILEALRAENVLVRSSCEAGSCGSCRTTLVAGDVDHRDFVLSEDERATQIMVCCSRARSGTLTLGL